MVTKGPKSSQVSERLLGILLHLRSVEDKRGGGTRDLIVAFAMSEFARRGYAGTSMRQIAAGCGIKAASLYAHFPEGKQQLLREGLRDIYDEFLAYLVAPLREGMDDATALRTVVQQHIRWQLAEGDKAMAWDAAVQQFGVADVLDEDTIDRVRAHQALYHSYLQALVKSSGAEPANDRTTAVVALCDQARRWVDRARDLTEQQNEVVERVWALVRSLVPASD